VGDACVLIVFAVVMPDRVLVVGDGGPTEHLPYLCQRRTGDGYVTDWFACADGLVPGCINEVTPRNLHRVTLLGPGSVAGELPIFDPRPA
jgi:hypothetical protein